MGDAFARWFQDLIGCSPGPWHSELAADPAFGTRLIRILTGLGKTAGTVLAWLFYRVQRDDPTWPRRLVFCLPMRVLVEQREAAVRDWIIGLRHLHIGSGTSIPDASADQSPLSDRRRVNAIGRDAIRDQAANQTPRQENPKNR
jgi:hypothetical protein